MSRPEPEPLSFAERFDRIDLALACLLALMTGQKVETAKVQKALDDLGWQPLSKLVV